MPAVLTHRFEGLKRIPIAQSLSVALALLAVIVAVATRARAVQMLPTDYDEDDYLKAAQQYAAAIQSGDWAAIPDLNYRTEHPPLQKLLFGAAIAGLPATEELPDLPTSAGPGSLPEPHRTAARTASAVFGVIEVALLALVNPLAALLLGVHTWTIKYTSQIMLESVAATASAASALAFMQSRVWERGKFNGWLLLSALMLGITASGKYTYAIVGIAALIHWGRVLWIEDGWAAYRRGLPLMLAWGLISLLAFYASNPYLWPDPLGRLSASLLYHAGYASGAAEISTANFPPWQPFVWLAGPVPWHPGVFWIAIDLLITVFALLGLKALWERQPFYAIWLISGVALLLLWPTKWPQYILILTFPLSLAAAEGVRVAAWEPLQAAWAEWRRPRPADPKARRLARRETLRAAPWLLPGLIAVLLITFYPLLYQVAVAFTNTSGISIRDAMNGGVWRAVFEGLTGQAEAVNVAVFETPRAQVVQWIGLRLVGQIMNGIADLLVFDLLWTVLVVGLQIALGLAVALTLHHSNLRFKKFWLTLFVIPWALPEFVGALSWLQLFDPNSGWFALSSQNIPGDVILGAVAGWRGSPTLTVMVLLVAGVWMGWPVIMLGATAGLRMIPADVWDAAAVDGASPWQRFVHIIGPMLLPLLLPVILIRVIYAFNQFYLFYVFNPDYPYLTGATLAYYMASPWWGSWFGASAAISTITLVILMLLLLWFDRRSRISEGVAYV